MRWAAFPLLALVLSGCFMPPADCRPVATAGWADVATYDALGEAGIKASDPSDGLPYRADDLDAQWRGYRLRSAHWTAGYSEYGVPSGMQDSGGVTQAGKGSRVQFGVSIVTDGEEDPRPVFDLVARNLTTASQDRLDEIYSDMLENKQEGPIRYPDDPALRTVESYSYGVTTTLPLRLAEMDAELRADHAPQHIPHGIGQAVRRIGPWNLHFDLPVRSTELQVGEVDVEIVADATGMGRALARPVASEDEGRAAIVAAFEDLGVPTHAIGQVSYEAVPECGN